MLIDAFSLRNQTAIVTGAGKGIGKAIAVGLAEQGANVVCVARTQSDIDQTVELIRATGAEALAVCADVTNESDLSGVVEQTRDKWDTIDILINNAGAPGQGYGSIKKVDKQRFEDTLAINLTSAYTLTHLCLPAFNPDRQASIVNVSSALSWLVDKRFSAYAAAKAGLNQMTRVMAYELAPRIRVNAIAPGAIETPSTAFIVENPDLKAKTEKWIPLKRLGTPDDIAHAALFLASDASSFISGKIIEIDGGMQALPGTAIEEVIAAG